VVSGVARSAAAGSGGRAARAWGAAPFPALAPVLSPAVALALALALAAAGCGHSPDGAAPPAGGRPAEAVPEQEIFDYRLIETAAGQRRWVLDSSRMQKFPDQEDLELFDVRMDFYRDGAYYSTLTSRRGRANPTRKDLFAWGTVVVTTVDGRRLETEELRYDNASGRITNEVFNRFTRGDDVATGYGLVATPALDYFELKESVDASVADDGRRGEGPGAGAGAAPARADTARSAGGGAEEGRP
jgi:LPS export ABC transporter protein LptC